MKRVFPLALISLMLVLSGCTLPWQKTAPVACTMEAKLCSDGSYVGRTGPNCEFTACPTPKLCTDGTVCKVTSTSQIANPASVNCKNEGGQLVIKKRGDGGEYGLCWVGEGLACEEWAMMRGDCPKDGAYVGEYNGKAQSEAQIYCVASGGSILDASNAICKFKDGSQCDVKALYDGTCQKGDVIGNNRVCTMEVKVCSDGSAVGRTGPNCEFSPCPTDRTYIK